MKLGQYFSREEARGGFDNIPAANLTSVKSSLPRMIFSWNGVICGISVVVSNLSCVLLCSFFFSILPTKRNLLTHLDTALVLAITALVNALVSAPVITKKSKVFIAQCKLCNIPPDALGKSTICSLALANTRIRILHLI